MVDIADDELQRRIEEAAARIAAQREAADAEQRQSGTVADTVANTVAAVLAMQRADKGKTADAGRSKTVSFRHDPTAAEQAIRPWAGSALLLRPSSTHARVLAGQEDQGSKDALDIAYRKDHFLPRGAFSQALKAFTALWAMVGPVPAEGEETQAVLLEEMHLAIQARATDEHSPIWRRYALYVLAEMMDRDHEAGQGLGINIAEINEDILAQAERDLGHPPGTASNFVGNQNNLVAGLLRADTAAVVESQGTRMDRLARYAITGVKEETVSKEPELHPSPSSPSALMALRARARTSPSARTVHLKRPAAPTSPQPFRRAPLPSSARDSGADIPRGARVEYDRPRGHQQGASFTFPFCTTCLKVAPHDFRDCGAPMQDTKTWCWSDWDGSGRQSACHSSTDTTSEKETRADARASSATTAPPATPPTAKPAITSVRAPEDVLTAIRRAFRETRSSYLSPRAFDEALQKEIAARRHKFAHVVEGAQKGFSVGRLAMPLRTIVAPKHYPTEKDDMVAEWCRKALEAKFAAGPFTRADIESAVGPFAEGDGGGGAINEEVKDEEWACEWFLVADIKILLSRASRLVMGFDLADAYQQVPNLPLQRQRFVFQVGDAFFVWLVGMFGIATMAAIFGQLCDILCSWLSRYFMDVTAHHFADDHMLLWDGQRAPPSEAQIYEQVHWFGWRVHATKRFGW
ncbi:hypothetical protein V8E36_001889 [Tilletia maclaganii]